MIDKSLYFVGASVTAQNGGWAHQFARELAVKDGVDRVKIINAVGGTDIVFGAANHHEYISQLDETPPFLAFIEYSTGDLNFRRALSLIEPFIKVLVRDLQARGAAVYFLNLYRSDCTDEGCEQWREIYRKVGAELGVKTLDLYKEFEQEIAVDPSLQQLWYRDNVHTTESGSVKVAQRVLALTQNDNDHAQSFEARSGLYPASVDFEHQRENTELFVYKNSGQIFEYTCFPGEGVVKHRSRRDVYGALIITGPRSGFIDVAVDGVHKGVYRGFDHNSYYDRPMPVIFKGPFAAGSEITLGISTERLPNFNECKVAHPDFSLSRQIKVVGFIECDFKQERKMNFNLENAIKELRALRLAKQFADGISYFSQINGAEVESLELQYEFLSCLYFSNQIADAVQVAQRLLAYDKLAPHHYVLCLKTFSRCYRYDLLEPLVSKIPEKTLPELQATINGTETVARFLKDSDALLSSGMITSKETMSTDGLVEYLRGVIEAKLPTSFIRVGDGEGCLIGATLHKGPAIDAWSHHFFDLQFGKSFVESTGFGEGRTKITKSLTDAVDEADVLGILKVAQMKRLEEIYAGPIQLAGNYYNYLYLSRNKIHAKRIVDSCVHYDLAFVTFVREFLISGAAPIGIIGPHASVADAVRTRPGVDFVFHQTPPESRYFSEAAQNHYPDVFKKIAKSLKKGTVGRVYFVGAGLLGKVYCNIIKQNGGIAIDVGSLMDLFAGHLHTRSPLGRLKNAKDLLITPELIPGVNR